MRKAFLSTAEGMEFTEKGVGLVELRVEFENSEFSEREMHSFRVFRAFRG